MREREPLLVEELLEADNTLAVLVEAVTRIATKNDDREAVIAVVTIELVRSYLADVAKSLKERKSFDAAIESMIEGARPIPRRQGLN